jgi:Cu-Zn family superoxide dismutase
MITLRIAGLVAAAFLIPACGKKTKEVSEAPPPTAAAPAPTIDSSRWRDASAPFVDRAGATVGEASFEDGLGGVILRVKVSGLTPGWHGIHFHEAGDCSDAADGFKASGGHINPDNVEHGLLNPNGAHRADIPNILADANGVAEAEIFRPGIHLAPSEEAAAINGPFPLIDDDGFAVVVHVNPDDHMSQPIGGAGDRVACAAVAG